MVRISERISTCFILSAFALQFGLSNSSTALTEQEYALRCAKAEALCRDGDDRCASWREAFNEHGSVCPGVNAPATAAMRGPPETQRPTSYPNVVKTQASTDTSNLGSADSLARIQADCDASHGRKTFSSQVKCIKSGILLSQALSATTVSDDIHLYTLTADNLADEVGRKAILPTAARVELQKAFLEFRDRVNRQNAEMTAKEDAARFQAQQIADAAQERENQRRASAQADRERENQRLAAAQAEQREIDRRQEELVAFCVSEANQRLAANPIFVSDHIYLGLFETSYGAGTYRNVDRLCAKDNYWYKQVPPPQKIINCSRSPGWGGINCTEQ